MWIISEGLRSIFITMQYISLWCYLKVTLEDDGCYSYHWRNQPRNSCCNKSICLLKAELAKGVSNDEDSVYGNKTHKENAGFRRNCGNNSRKGADASRSPGYVL